MEPILIVNSLSLQGYKITKFLKNNGYIIYGTDGRKDEGRDKATKFMRTDLRNQNNVALLLQLFCPKTVIYCMEQIDDAKQFEVTDYNSIILQNFLRGMAQNNISNIVVCDGTQPSKLDTPKDLVEFNLRTLTALFSQKYNWHSKIINKEDNLLTAVKGFIELEGGEN